MVGVGRSDPMDFHALEAMQCMVERRQGGETGVKPVQLIDRRGGLEGRPGGALVQRLARGRLVAFGFDPRTDRSPTDGPQNLTANDELRRLARHPSAYFIDYADGTHATLLMLNGVVADYTFAARLRGSDRIESTQFLLPPNPNVAYSACLMHKVEEMIETGPGSLPGRANAARERRARELSRVENPGEPPRSKRPISTSIIPRRNVAVLPDVTRSLERGGGSFASGGLIERKSQEIRSQR